MDAPPLFWTLVTVGLGPLIGSALAAMSVRLPAGRPVGWDRSACDHCGHRLGPLELVPIASFLVLGGRCAHCRAPILRRHLAFELAGLAVAAWAALATPGPLGLVSALLGWQLLLLAALDAEHLWLPRVLTLPLIATGLAAAAATGALVAGLIGAAAGFTGLWLVAWAYRRLRGREGLGGGDAWLLAGGGAWVGWTGLPLVLTAAALSGLAYALWPLLRGRGLQTDRELPFGLFLAGGIWLVWLYSPL